MVFNGVSKVVMEQMVDTATKLEAVADKSWVPWADCLIPNVSHWVRVEAEARVHEEHNRQI